MKKISLSMIIAALLISGCSDNKEQEKQTKVQTPPTASAQKSVDIPMHGAPQTNLYGVSTDKVAPQSPTSPPTNVPVEVTHVGSVLESMDAAGYTYAKINEDGNIYWIAGPKTTINVGDKISFIEQMVMENFRSKALNRTFDQLVFATTLIPLNASGAKAAPKDATHDCQDCDTAKQPMPQQANTAQVPASPYTAHGAPAAQQTLQPINVAKADGGYSVEEINKQKDSLKDKNIKLNAQVVKVSKNIMGKDWIHLQDGSGSAGTNDIIATSKNSNVNVGDIVVVTGKVVTNIDLGYGYKFAVMIEEAALAPKK